MFSKELFILAISTLISLILFVIPVNPFTFSSVCVISCSNSFRPVDSLSILVFVVPHLSCLKFSSIGCVQVGQVSFFSKKFKVFLCVSRFCVIFVSNLFNCNNFLSNSDLSFTFSLCTAKSVFNCSIFFSYTLLFVSFCCNDFSFTSLKESPFDFNDCKYFDSVSYFVFNISVLCLASVSLFC